jgi:hypothetical protein
MKKNDIIAFPYGGMTLRDYFAAQALYGLIKGYTENLDIPWVSITAYELADVMLKEREK